MSAKLEKLEDPGKYELDTAHTELSVSATLPLTPSCLLLSIQNM